MTARRGPARRKARTWKSGASGCWWAIVPRWNDSTHPLPWNCGYTRAIAWQNWSEARPRRVGDMREPSRAKWKSVRVRIVEVLPARSRK